MFNYCYSLRFCVSERARERVTAREGGRAGERVDISGGFRSILLKFVLICYITVLYVRLYYRLFTISKHKKILFLGHGITYILDILKKN